MEYFMALLIGAFFAETVKNVAKGSANMLQESVKSRFDREFTQLGLSIDDTPEQFQKKLQEKPEILEAVQQKLEANPDIIEELLEIIREQTKKETIGTAIKAKNIGQVINNPTAPIHQKNKFS